MRKINCPYCDSDSQKIYLKTRDWNWRIPGEFDLLRCDKCGALFSSSIAAHDVLKKYYPQNYYTRASGLVKPTEEKTREIERGFEYRFKTIQKFSKAGRVLDVGCGDGYFLKYLKARNYEAWGVEMSEQACEYAVEKLGIEREKIVCGDFSSVSLPEYFFDLITLNDALEHLPEPKRVLEKCSRLLCVGGGIFIQVPNFNSLGRKLFGAYWTHIDAPRHLVHFTAKTLSLFLKDYKIVSIKTKTDLEQAYISGYSDSLRYLLAGYGFYNLKPKGEKHAVSGKTDAEEEMFCLKKWLRFTERSFFKLLGFFADLIENGEMLQIYAKK